MRNCIESGNPATGSAMNVLRKCLIPVLAVGASLAPAALTCSAHAQALGPTLVSPATPSSLTLADGFIRRWLILEPIGVNGLTQNAVRAMVKKEYFPDQFT